jgi:ubiquinone/menaquinone biosynthesis C-methylase UbiE
MVLQNRDNFNYISIDLQSPQAMVRMDITDLKFEDNKFDFIFCISVMHFVENDLQGFREMFRVLKKGGRLLFASGVNEQMEKTITYKTRSVSLSYAVRTYGRDVSEVMSKAGFSVRIYHPAADVGEDMKKKYGMNEDPVYLLTKDR